MHGPLVGNVIGNLDILHIGMIEQLAGFPGMDAVSQFDVQLGRVQRQGSARPVSINE
ncbi:hypothetical protein PSCICF_34190 [Pseudomonas cichorii]|nr:hypothetical protein PSCICF_34190 [Pseudomonas cichorii]GFM62908.1 hypothetical protein PSCICG_40680 [Pseudomonas cichorii]